MNLVGYNLALVEELKIHMINKLNDYHRDGFIVEGRFEELLEKEVKALDERINTMRGLL
ncbi:hypothetical protein [Paenibacillus tianjinensis]|uniref:Spo0E like sporulation regulatory protein n=1 Tax=Paenibacillus tianjinensis TaxID=2810347 RepID=A0ABX7L9F3_9BACL|nr:hypothetical protein [Paenibacillus tianjinensis]QSF43348.1 hypothetical protein JRJ22_18965 [Paenibacillus tianjinensis]